MSESTKQITSLRTKPFAHHSVAFSPFHPKLLALASSANYGLVGNGRLHVVSQGHPPAATGAGGFDASTLRVDRAYVLVSPCAVPRPTHSGSKVSHPGWPVRRRLVRATREPDRNCVWGRFASSLGHHHGSKSLAVFPIRPSQGSLGLKVVWVLNLGPTCTCLARAR